MKHRVYLAGPISGCTFADCTDWRKNVKLALDSPSTVALSPMRAKEFWCDKQIVDNTDIGEPLASDRGIMCRDRNDCCGASVLLVNFLDATTVSIGTVMEIAWANKLQIPIVVVLPNPCYDIHDHPMLRQAYDYVCSSLAEAVHITKTIIGEDF